MGKGTARLYVRALTWAPSELPILSVGISGKSFGYSGGPNNRMQHFFRCIVLNGTRLDSALKNVGSVASRSGIAVGKAGEEDRAEDLFECLCVYHRSLSVLPIQVAPRAHNRIVSKGGSPE
jgi:hypothetical protein